MSRKNALDLDSYRFVVRPLSQEDGGGYLPDYPDVQHCMAAGETRQEAIVDGRVALEACLATLAEMKLSIRPPGATGNSRQCQ